MLSSEAGYGIIFLFGLLTSIHCIGMCGGIMLTGGMVSNHSPYIDEDNTYKNILKPALLYNCGRVISYTTFGLLAGGLGYFISLTGIWKGILPITGGVFMIITGLSFLGSFSFLRYLQLRMPKIISEKVLKNKSRNLFVLGIISTFLPCGPLQAVQMYALLSGSLVKGALSMFLFSIGTVPALFFLGIASLLLNVKFTRNIMKLSSIFIIILGFFMISRGLSVTGISINLLETFKKEENSIKSEINGDEQVIRYDLKEDSFTPILVQKDIKVKWIINVQKENLNAHNSSIKNDDLNISIDLKEGENRLEFTPRKEGTFIYSSSCGMTRSKIIVVKELK